MLWKTFWMTLSLFTICPCPQRWEEKATPCIMPAFPLAGILTGLVWFFLARLCQGLPLLLGAFLLALWPWFFSGLMHLDGFMDVSDALLSRRDQPEMLRILKDPHTGAFSVISVILLILLQLICCHTLLAQGRAPLPLLAVPVLSRSLAGLLIVGLEPLASSGYAKMLHAGPQRPRLLVLGLFGAACCVFLILCRALPALLAQTLVFAAAALMARSKLGGVNGDVAGFSLVLSELAGLLALALWR